MSTAEKSAFRRALVDCIAQFNGAEATLRSSFVGDPALRASAEDVILERSTRRFLIDELLRALDWDPDVPAAVAEEARSRSRGASNPLFFDYFGRAQDGTPALVVEAKRFDSDLPKQPGGAELTSRQIASLISYELGRLKSDAGERRILASWADWLNDLIVYVRSLSRDHQQRLARVAITAGRWLIVFESPQAAFVANGTPDQEEVSCFRSFEEMIDGSDKIFELLNRGQLVDTLPLTMTPGEALAVLQPGAIQSLFRGVVVKTQIVGPVRGPYPLRSVHPAVILRTASRGFAVTSYLSPPLVEPTDAAGLAGFLNSLATQGNQFQAEVLALLGRADLAPSVAGQYPLAARPALPNGSLLTAHAFQPAPLASPSVPQLVCETGERGAVQEFLVITGDTWFYKSVTPTGPACELHAWPAARLRGAAGVQPSMGGVATSYTASGTDQHCEHEGLRGTRRERCQLRPLETHMCCRACLFHDVCWRAGDLERMPCARATSDATQSNGREGAETSLGPP